MAIRKYKPTTPARRGASVSDFGTITRSKPRSRSPPAAAQAGRNVHGRITSRHRGGGHKRRYRVIDFRRNKDGVPATVAAVEYDPNRSARIALLHYHDGEKRYILAPKNLIVGQRVESGPGSDIRIGNALPLANIPVGTTVHAVELRPGGGAKLGRSAGTAIQLLAKEGRTAALRLPSGRDPPGRCALPGHDRLGGQRGARAHQLGKAGRSRWKVCARRPAASP
jgi:large subunit ribosomal protein L2